MFLSRPLPTGRLEGLAEKVPHASPLNPTFVLQPFRQTATLSQLQPGLTQGDTADHS